MLYLCLCCRNHLSDIRNQSCSLSHLRNTIKEAAIRVAATRHFTRFSTTKPHQPSLMQEKHCNKKTVSQVCILISFYLLKEDQLPWEVCAKGWFLSQTSLRKHLLLCSSFVGSCVSSAIQLFTERILIWCPPPTKKKYLSGFGQDDVIVKNQHCREVPYSLMHQYTNAQECTLITKQSYISASFRFNRQEMTCSHITEAHNYASGKRLNGYIESINMNLTQTKMIGTIICTI